MTDYNKLLPLYEEYYENQFPVDLLVRWFSYNGSIPPNCREWSYEGL